MPLIKYAMHPVTAILLLLMLAYLGWGQSPVLGELGFTFMLLAGFAMIGRGFFRFIGDISRVGRIRR